MGSLLKAYNRGHVAAAVIAVALACLLKATWFKWGDLVIDLGREVYVPARLAEGAVLYRDIFYLYGPLPPYLNAILFKIFGTHILSLVLGGVLVTALTSVLLYKISRMFLNVFFATLTVLVFLFVLAFGHYVPIGNYNFILPYSYPATHGILFSLGALYFFFRSLDRPQARYVVAAGACVFLAMVSRAEIGAMLALSLLPAVITVKRAGAKPPLARPLLLYPIAGACLVYGSLFLLAGPRIMESNLADLFRSNTQASPFAALLSGINAPGQNIGLMMKSAFFYLLFAVWFALAGCGAGLAARLQVPAARYALYAVIAVAAGFGALAVLKTLYHFELQYRSLPLIYLGVGGAAAVACARRSRAAADLKMAALALFSFLLVLRILLHVHAWHYGFYILVPGIIVYHVFFFRTLPQLAASRFITAAFYAGFTLVLVVLMAAHVRFSAAMYAHRTLAVPSPRGEISVLAGPQGSGVSALVDLFRNSTPEGATLAVFPEGLMINFLSGREHPLYYYTFLPQDMVRPSVEQAMVDDMALKKPDYVVVLQRPVEEYGSRGFGVDYAHKLMAHIQAEYMPFARYGPLPFAPGNFSAVVFKLKK